MVRLQILKHLGITIDDKIVSDDNITITFIHEAGHSGGLNHPWELSDIEKKILPEFDQKLNLKDKKKIKAQIKLIKDNFLNSWENEDKKFRANSGSQVLFKQLVALYYIIKEKSPFEPEDLKSRSNE